MGLLEVMKQQRYEDITVSDLCARLQIPRKAFYRYFSGKDGALHALIDHVLLELEEVFMEPAADEDVFLLQLQSFFGFWLKNKDFLGAMVQSNLSGLLIEQSISHALHDLNFGGKRENVNQMRASEYLTQFAVCGLMSIVLRWHREGYSESPAQMAQIARDIMNHPISRI